MKVFYTPRMVVADAQSYSPSAAKPKQVVESWLASGFPIQIIQPKPVTREQLYRAHSQEYVDGVLSLKIRNGFGNTLKSVAKSLLYTNGSMLAAAHEALLSKSITCSPTSGFHHAHWHKGSAYCTFNGLMVTTLDLLEIGIATKIGILDCDMHYGDGTQHIIDTLGVADAIVHFSVGETPHNPNTFLSCLEEKILELYSECDILLYQAGADPHVDDPLGGWLSTQQLMQRDKIVFDTARLMNLPVTWNLAGGYQRDSFGSISPVLEIHDNTMRVGVIDTD